MSGSNTPYSESMMESIKRLEAMREKRIEQKLPLHHVKEYHGALKKLGIRKKLKAPLLFADYRFEEAVAQVH